MIGTHILNSYAIEPVKAAARYAIDNPISTTIYNTAEKSLEHLKSAANFVASFGFENPGLWPIVYKENDAGAGASVMVPVIITGAVVTFVAATAIAERYLLKASTLETTIRFRDSMEEHWEIWESGEYESWHPLRFLDEYPHVWEPAIKSAIESGKEEEFTELVRRYRAEVGTKYLRDRTAVRSTVKDKNLEAIILGTAQTAPYH